MNSELITDIITAGSFTKINLDKISSTYIADAKVEIENCSFFKSALLLKGLIIIHRKFYSNLFKRTKYFIDTYFEINNTSDTKKTDNEVPYYNITNRQFFKSLAELMAANEGKPIHPCIVKAMEYYKRRTNDPKNQVKLNEMLSKLESIINVSTKPQNEIWGVDLTNFIQIMPDEEAQQSQCNSLGDAITQEHFVTPEKHQFELDAEFHSLKNKSAPVRKLQIDARLQGDLDKILVDDVIPKKMMNMIKKTKNELDEIEIKRYVQDDDCMRIPIWLSSLKGFLHRQLPVSERLDVLRDDDHLEVNEEVAKIEFELTEVIDETQQIDGFEMKVREKMKKEKPRTTKFLFRLDFNGLERKRLVAAGFCELLVMAHNQEIELLQIEHFGEIVIDYEK